MLAYNQSSRQPDIPPTFEDTFGFDDGIKQTTLRSLKCSHQYMYFYLKVLMKFDTLFNRNYEDCLSLLVIINSSTYTNVLDYQAHR